MPSRVTFTFADATGLPAGTRPNATTFQTLVRSIDQAAFWALRNGTASGAIGVQFSSIGRRLLARAVAGQVPSSGAAASMLEDGSSSGSGRLLQEAELQAASGTGSTTLDASALGAWANCSSTCTYTGLPSGYYSMNARQVDAAGNVGNATEAAPFQVDASLDGSSGLPTWAIIVIAAGGAVVALVATALLVWCCCKRRRGGSAAVAGSTGGHNFSTGPPSPWQGPPPTPGAWGDTPSRRPAGQQLPFQQQQVQRPPVYPPPYGNSGGYPMVAGEAACGAGG